MLSAEERSGSDVDSGMLVAHSEQSSGGGSSMCSGTDDSCSWQAGCSALDPGGGGGG